MSRLRHRATVWRVLMMALAIGGVIGTALPAAGQRASREPWPASTAPTDPDHKSYMFIPPGTRFPITRRLTVGLGKSMLVELPVDLQNVLVSKPEVLDAVVQSSRQVYLLAKDAGEANAIFIGPDGQKLVFLEIVVARDMAPLSEALMRLLPGSRIKVEALGENIVLTGSVINPVDANRAAEIAARYTKVKDAVVNMLSVGAKEQVLLKVQVVEMQRTALRRIGVDLPGAVLASGNITVTKVIQNAFPVTSPAVAGAVSGGPFALPFVAAGSAAQTTWSSNGNTVATLVQALERAGMIRTLAEPNLTAISGETAKFLAGGEFPVPVATVDRQVSVVWKSFGVGLSFRPIVVSDGRISLNIGAEVSELSQEGAVTLNEIAIPALKVRRAETTLELPSGGTLAMAGLLSDDTRQSVEGVPGIKSLPVLGALFRSNDYQRRETELVILVTPYLATHAAKAEFATPDKGFAPSNTLRELFMGHINRIYGPPGYAPQGHYQGEFGFIVEYPDAGVKG